MSNELKKAIEEATHAVEELQKSEVGGSTQTEALLKSHVKQYTKKDGSLVKEHDDKRQAHPHPIEKHAGKLAAAADKEDAPYEKNSEAWNVASDMRSAAKHMANKDHAKLKSTLDGAHDNYTKEKIIEHIHPDHWEGLGIKAVDKERSKKEFEKKHGKGEKTEEQKPVPPQADSNRKNWDDLGDNEHPREAMRRIGSKELGQITQGKVDAQKKAKEELAARGVDENGKWLGFDKAEKHHGVSTKHMGGDAADSDEIMGHFQTVYHKVLGAIASGHTDAKRLAGEELANRGHDHNGKWIGFDKADKLHGVK